MSVSAPRQLLKRRGRPEVSPVEWLKKGHLGTDMVEYMLTDGLLNAVQAGQLLRRRIVVEDVRNRLDVSLDGLSLFGSHGEASGYKCLIHHLSPVLLLQKYDASIQSPDKSRRTLSDALAPSCLR